MNIQLTATLAPKNQMLSGPADGRCAERTERSDGEKCEEIGSSQEHNDNEGIIETTGLEKQAH